MYPLGFFETCPNGVIFVALSAIGLDGVAVVYVATVFGELVVCSGATLSSGCWYNVVVTKFLGKFLISWY